MKKTKQILHRVRWFIYIGFLCLFLKGIGLYRFIVQSRDENSIYMDSPLYKDSDSKFSDLSLNREIQYLQDSILDLRRSQIKSGDLYNYDEYISDLAQINLLEIQNGFSPNGSGQGLNNPLLDLYSEAVRSGENHSPTEDESESAENIYSSITGIHGWISPKDPDWDQTYDSEINDIGWKDIFSWIFRKYSKFFPLILLLYIFWFFIDSKVSKFMKKKSYIFCISVSAVSSSNIYANP